MLKTFCTCAALPLCYQLRFSLMSLVCFAVLSQNADVAIIEMMGEMYHFILLVNVFDAPLLFYELHQQLELFTEIRSHTHTQIKLSTCV